MDGRSDRPVPPLGGGRPHGSRRRPTVGPRLVRLTSVCPPSPPACSRHRAGRGPDDEPRLEPAMTGRRVSPLDHAPTAAERPPHPCPGRAGGRSSGVDRSTAARSTSSKPTTLMSPGTEQPRSWIARMAPIAIASLMREDGRRPAAGVPQPAERLAPAVDARRTDRDVVRTDSRARRGRGSAR